MPSEIICVSAQNVVRRVFCSAPDGWFVFMLKQYFCVDMGAKDRVSGGPWAAWGSWEYVLGECSDRGLMSLVGATGVTRVLGRIAVCAPGD